MSAESSIFNIAQTHTHSLSLYLSIRDSPVCFPGFCFRARNARRLDWVCGMCQWVEKMARVVGISRGEDGGAQRARNSWIKAVTTLS